MGAATFKRKMEELESARDQEGVAVELRGKPGEEVITELKEAKIFLKEGVAHRAYWLQRSQGLKKKEIHGI